MSKRVFIAAVLAALLLTFSPGPGVRAARAGGGKFGQMARIHFVGTWSTLHKSSLDSNFTAIPLLELNRMVFKELSKLGDDWKVYSMDDDGVREEDVQLAVVVSRADINENYYADLYGEGDLYKFLVDVGVTLVFFNSYSKEIYHTRTLTGELPHIDKVNIDAAKRTELFRNCFKQTLASIFPKAYAEYNPTWIKGKVTAVAGKKVSTDLGYKKGMVRGAILHYEGGSVGASEIDMDKSSGALRSGSKGPPKKGQPIYICSNKKGMNSPVQFQVRKFNLSKRMDPAWRQALEPYKYDFMQWLHDELAKTGKVALLSPELDWLAQGWEQYLGDCEACGAGEGVERDELVADYAVNGLLQKVVKMDLAEGKLDKWVGYFAYPATAIMKIEVKGGEVTFVKKPLRIVPGKGEERVSGKMKVHIVKGKVTTDLEIVKDAIEA